MSKKTNRVTDQSSFIGSKLNFSGKEAYNLLRTNIMFSVRREDRRARILGVTSSVHGEGKSLTSINLAYSLAENNYKVLIMECDLRLPTFAKKLKLPPSAGLSNILAGIETDQQNLLHKDVLIKGLNIVQAGDIPPNPSELLGSKQFQALMNSLVPYYDFIILDLPPVGEVTDALVVSEQVDGMIVVVRQDYTNQSDLNYTMRQLELVDAKVVGFVYNGAAGKKGKYGYGKYKKYGKYAYAKKRDS
ncbi:MAG: CpsD/CapB family tyrosine-protein kinase [Saccharofermentans sp.]|nr:CpsD/CapB family tyrosine-protein kinase [Saccharofermentans sp.]